MSDSKTVAIDLQTPLTQPTYNKYDDTPNYVIDYIFVNSNVDVMTFKVTTEKISGGYVSDHYGIYSTIAFGNHYCGGIAGTSTGTIINTYFNGKVNGCSSGTNKGTVKNCYCVSGLSNNGGGTAKTADAMKAQSFANSLNFLTSEWKYDSGKNGGYPYLNVIDRNLKLERLSSSKYKLSNGVIKNAKVNTTVSAFIANFSNEGLGVYNGSTAIAGTALVCTGYRVILKDGSNELDSAYIIVSGDVDCDGKITQNDYVTVKSAFKELILLGAVQQTAADANSDGKLTVSDYLMLKRFFAGTYVM